MNTKRTHRLLPLAIALVMALSLLPTKAWGYYVLQGSGTEASPYLISSAQALEFLAEQVNDGALKTEGVYFRQTAVRLQEQLVGAHRQRHRLRRHGPDL